jgi:hypothetical protein
MTALNPTGASCRRTLHDSLRARVFDDESIWELPPLNSLLQGTVRVDPPIVDAANNLRGGMDTRRRVTARLSATPGGRKPVTTRAGAPRPVWAHANPTGPLARDELARR